MTSQAEAQRFGPGNATLHVRTGRRGAAAKAGHDLLIEVTAWEATLHRGDDGRPVGLELDADARSLHVREGTGGIQDLKDEDREEIRQTIDDQVLRGQSIEFRSTSVEAAGSGAGGPERLHVAGVLAMAGRSHPVELELSVAPDGGISGSATLRQTDWGIEPYSGLFGALKVADEVEIVAEAGPPPDRA